MHCQRGLFVSVRPAEVTNKTLYLVAACWKVRSQTMNTVGTHVSIAVLICPHFYYIMLYYTYTLCVCYECISVKRTFVRNTILNYKLLYTMLHKSSCVHIRFGKWVVSNRGGSTEAKFCCGRVSGVFSGLFFGVCCRYLQISSGSVQVLMGALHPSTLHVLQGCCLKHRYLNFVLKKCTVTRTYNSCHDCSITLWIFWLLAYNMAT